MSSRDEILRAVRRAQSDIIPAPPIPDFAPYFGDPTIQFEAVLRGGGASVVPVAGTGELRSILAGRFDLSRPVWSTVPALSEFALSNASYTRPHELQATELMILDAEFGVAENGAVWITDRNLPQRVLPFIPEHLAVVIPAGAIERTMHDAYRRIGAQEYGWAAFIAGPSKTADIEQSLVLGAHGPRSMTVFLLR